MFRYAIFGLLVIATGLVSVRMGERGAQAFERLMIDRLERGLVVLEIDWADVRANGLRLELRGHAPDIYARDLALEFSRAAAPIATVIDYTSVGLAPPPRRGPIWVEILRDEQGLTLTGRFQGKKMRDRMIAGLTAVTPELEIHDLTGINAARPGIGWGLELQVAALAAARLPNAYVSIEPGALKISGSVRDAAHRNAVSLELLALAGSSVRLTLELREPLVVVAPFVFAAVKDTGGIRIEACAVRSGAEQTTLEATLNRQGIDLGGVGCPVALGGPSGDWVEAVKLGLEALSTLPAGRLQLEYHAVELTMSPPGDSTELEAAQTALAAALPTGYSLRQGVEVVGAASEKPTASEGRYWMRFSRAEGLVKLSGAVVDRTARQVIETYAAVQFGQDAVRPAMILAGDGQGADAQPSGWMTAALVALDALSGVGEGTVELSPERITINGTVSGAAEAGQLQRLMERKAPEGYRVESALRVDLPAKIAAVALSPDRCAVVLSASILNVPVTYAPGSAVIEVTSEAALDRLGEVLQRCENGRIEIGGHTDSQGSVGLNQRLSRARAEAVLDELIARGVPLDMLTARGYGELQPVASNETELGRAKNRRIEFKSLADAPEPGEAGSGDPALKAGD